MKNKNKNYKVLSTIGVYIDTSKIQFIEINNKNKLNTFFIDTAVKFTHSNFLDRGQDIADQIKNALKTNNFKSKKVAICLPIDSVYNKVLIIPEMKKELFEANLFHDFNKYLVDDIENYNCDYRIISSYYENGFKFYKILVNSILKEEAVFYKKIFEKAGLKPIYMDTPSNCIEKFIEYHHKNDFCFKDNNILTIDCNKANIFFTLFEKGSYFAESISSINNSNFANYNSFLAEELSKITSYFANKSASKENFNRILFYGENAENIDLKVIKQYNEQLALQNYEYLYNISNHNSSILQNNSLYYALGAVIRRLKNEV